jgi:spermidine/putrescine-binding protein
MTGRFRPSMLIAAAALFFCASATSILGQEKTLTIASWGGAYAQSQQIAYYRPFEKKPGYRSRWSTTAANRHCSVRAVNIASAIGMWLI